MQIPSLSWRIRTCHGEAHGAPPARGSPGLGLGLPALPSPPSLFLPFSHLPGPQSSLAGDTSLISVSLRQTDGLAPLAAPASGLCLVHSWASRKVHQAKEFRNGRMSCLLPKSHGPYCSFCHLITAFLARLINVLSPVPTSLLELMKTQI